jgi:hypothetical protein
MQAGGSSDRAIAVGRRVCVLAPAQLNLALPSLYTVRLEGHRLDAIRPGTWHTRRDDTAWQP